MPGDRGAGDGGRDQSPCVLLVRAAPIPCATLSVPANERHAHASRALFPRACSLSAVLPPCTSQRDEGALAPGPTLLGATRHLSARWPGGGRAPTRPARSRSHSLYHLPGLVPSRRARKGRHHVPLRLRQWVRTASAHRLEPWGPQLLAAHCTRFDHNGCSY